MAINQNLQIALKQALDQSRDGEIYVVWRDDYRHYRDKFIVSKFNDYLEEASLMVDEYGMFENGEEV